MNTPLFFQHFGILAVASPVLLLIIMIKQFPVALGVLGAGGDPLEILREIPHFIAAANPAIAAIGVVSLLIMFARPAIRQRVYLLKPIPAPPVVLMVAVPM